jgi:hypothetical protein
MKKWMLMAVVAMMMTACGGGQKDAQQAQTDEAVEVTVGNFKEMAAGLVGKTVKITGTADHICKHDGKKLFLIDVDMPGRVKIVTGENLAAFNSENEGLDFSVVGTVAETIVDEAYLQEWEEELKAEMEEHKHLEDGEGHGEEEDDHHSAEAAYEQIAKYRQMMAEQGVDKLSFYHIVAISYEIIVE